MATCELFNNTEIAFISESAQTIFVDIHKVTGELIDPMSVKEAEWRMSRYGESECLVKLNTSSGITRDGSNFVVNLGSKHTKNMYGKFTHQITFTDVSNEKFIADLGRIIIKPAIC